MSSPNRSTFDIKDTFSSMNILNYTLVSSNYFPASSGSISFNSSENSNIIPPVFSSLYNNPCLKDVQAFYAKELPISSLDPITPPTILTPSPVLPPSLLFDHRYFFVLEELLPPKKQICSSSSSSTTLSNSSRNQTCNLVSPSFSVYTPTPPQVFEIGKCSNKMYLKHHEKQVEDILNYLDELSLHHIEKMEEGRLFLPPSLDLSNSCLEEFQQPEFEGYGPKTSKSINEDTSNEVRESPDAPLFEELEGLD
ncbi:hypothetical protein Tco_0542752 [Tanacetum coccineum]